MYNVCVFKFDCIFGIGYSHTISVLSVCNVLYLMLVSVGKQESPRKQTFLMINYTHKATKEVNEVEFLYVFCECFHENVVLSDQFNEFLSFACSTFYCPCVMLCGTRTGLDLDLSFPALVMVLVLTLSHTLKHTKMCCLILL